MMSASESTPTLSSWLLFNGNRDAQPSAPLPGSSAITAAKLWDLAPYAAILILPGGSLMALGLWLYRRQRRAALDSPFRRPYPGDGPAAAGPARAGQTTSP